MPRRRVKERRRRQGDRSQDDRSQGDRSQWSNPLEFAERLPPITRKVLSPLDAPSCSRSASGAAVPNVVHQAWFGGGKLMYAKLLSVLSVRYVLRPLRHVLHYDVQPKAALEWQCACRLATCVKANPRTRIFGRPLEHASAAADRYASDRTGKCGSAAARSKYCCPLGSYLVITPLAVPQLAPCASSGRAWRLWGSSVLPERGQATGRPATASGAQASRLQSRRFHRI